MLKPCPFCGSPPKKLSTKMRILPFKARLNKPSRELFRSIKYVMCGNVSCYVRPSTYGNTQTESLTKACRAWNMRS